MSTVSGPSQTYQTLTPAYAPLGKPVVGLESAENKDQTLPPVEETSASEKKRHQPDQKADAVASDGRSGKGNDRQQSSESSEAEQQQARAAALALAHPSGQDHSVAAEVVQVIAPAQLEITLQRAAALHAESGGASHGVAANTAVDSFNTAAGQTLAPGSLLDQRS